MACIDDPELLLAATCCRWPPTPERDAAIRQAAEQVNDWDRFAAVSHRQRVDGLVAAALRSLALPVPQRIADRAAIIVRRNLTAAAETARLLRLIEAAGYPVRVVKGVSLGQLAYGSITLKHSKDIDLLILPEHVPDVIALLEADAYRLTFPSDHLSPAQRRVLTRYGKDVAMVRSPAHPQLELHWRLFHNPRLLRTLRADGPAQRISLSSGVEAATFETADLYVYLAMHGTGDGWCRLKWLADFAALLVGRSQSEIAALHAHAAGLGGRRGSAVALLLAQQLLALPLDADFARALRRSLVVRMLTGISLRMMAVTDGRTEPQEWRGSQLRLLLLQPLLAGGVRYRWHVLRSMLFIQTDMYRSAAPPALYSLYPLLRVPLWIARRR